MNAAEKLAPVDASSTVEIRHDWTIEEVAALMHLPLLDLLLRAQTVHRRHFAANAVQLSTLMNIKTGACPEDCAYCPQSAHYQTEVRADPLAGLAAVREAASAAKAAGATRFCMGAAWRAPKDRDLDQVISMITEVKAQGLESCMTLGMLSAAQAQRLQAAGLDYYNHNLDTSAEFYEKIISTRTYQDRLDTLAHVRDAGLKVCCGGIIGMGEQASDRAALLCELANLPVHPESVPINMLVRVAGTPLAETAALDELEWVRMIAGARIMMPQATVRLSAGRPQLSDSAQVLCFMAGANSIFYGEKLLTTDNPEIARDQALFTRLGLHAA